MVSVELDQGGKQGSSGHGDDNDDNHGSDDINSQHPWKYVRIIFFTARSKGRSLRV